MKGGWRNEFFPFIVSLKFLFLSHMETIKSLGGFILGNRVLIYMAVLFFFAQRMRTKNLRVLVGTFRTDVSALLKSVLLCIVLVSGIVSVCSLVRLSSGGLQFPAP